MRAFGLLPKISSTPLSGKRAQSHAQPTGFTTDHPAALSARDTSSITRAQVSGSTSRPPRDRGVNIRKKPASARASKAGLENRPRCSASWLCARIIGAMRCAASSSVWSTVMLMVSSPLETCENLSEDIIESHDRPSAKLSPWMAHHGPLVLPSPRKGKAKAQDGQGKRHAACPLLAEVYCWSTKATRPQILLPFGSCMSYRQGRRGLGSADGALVPP